jgi:glycosyltransferase involved in cell wall biosynthesis
MTPQPRRVVLVTNGLTQAGAETQLMRLAAVLRHHGDEVGLLSILPTEAFTDELAALDIPVAHLRVRSPMRGPSAIQAATQVLRSWRPDIVISFVYQANVLGRLAGRLAGVPVVISSVRNEWFGGRSRELVMRGTDRLSTITTTNSHVAAERLIERRVVPRHRLVVIPNGVDLAPFQHAGAARAATRAELGIAEGQFVWLAAGRLEAQKDYPTLLAALAALAGLPAALPALPALPGLPALSAGSALPALPALSAPSAGARSAGSGLDHCLLIAGKGRLRHELEAAAAELGLGPRVRFLGVRSDIPELIAASDAVVLSSRFEGLPNVVMEAMAGARPVVATRVGGAPELVEDGVSGILVHPGDPDALASAMQQVMAAPELQRHAMGGRGQSIVSERFGLAAMGESWLRLLERFPSQPSDSAHDRGRSPLTANVAGAVPVDAIEGPQSAPRQLG